MEVWKYGHTFALGTIHTVKTYQINENWNL